MIEVIGVRFKKVGKMYYFDPDGETVQKGDFVLVETARGIEYGEVVKENTEVADTAIVAPLKKMTRKATDEDAKTVEVNIKKEKEAFEICMKHIAKLKLEMKLVDVEMTFDRNKLIFYFTSDGRVDFRELVKELASTFRTRIELRQIGVRDEAKMLNGIGICGRSLCCATFLGDFQTVSIKMAKEQNLSLNPTKISGICGRLMCCLKYEEEVYEELNKKLPKIGDIISTPDGKGEILATQVLQQQVKAAVRKSDNEPPTIGFYHVEDIKLLKTRKKKQQELQEKLENQQKQEKQEKQEKTDKPKADKPKSDKPKNDKPKADKPKVEPPKVEKNDRIERLKQEKLEKIEKLKAEKSKFDKSKLDKPKVDKPKMDKSKFEQPKAEKAKADMQKQQNKPQNNKKTKHQNAKPQNEKTTKYQGNRPRGSKVQNQNKKTGEQQNDQ
ncbi:regulatory iron-sulfur-containing complex subunit RicT [Chakrabartyella piscis]|uniref:regulatory iron-sulfur-containing complex subunit RicT n=1 Tax=Chakrabartyella piscis TaxID=2918914 RepID=UPI002F41CE66